MNVETVWYHKALFNQEIDFCYEFKKNLLNFIVAFMSPINEARPQPFTCKWEKEEIRRNFAFCPITYKWTKKQLKCWEDITRWNWVYLMGFSASFA